MVLWPGEGPADFPERTLDAPPRLIADVAVPAHRAAGAALPVRIHAGPAVIDQVARSSPADVVDRRNFGIDDALSLEFFVEGEDGALRGTVHVACSTAAGSEGACVCVGTGQGRQRGWA